MRPRWPLKTPGSEQTVCTFNGKSDTLPRCRLGDIIDALVRDRDGRFRCFGSLISQFGYQSHHAVCFRLLPSSLPLPTLPLPLPCSPHAAGYLLTSPLVPPTRIQTNLPANRSPLRPRARKRARSWRAGRGRRNRMRRWRWGRKARGGRRIRLFGWIMWGGGLRGGGRGDGGVKGMAGKGAEGDGKGMGRGWEGDGGR